MAASDEDVSRLEQDLQQLRSDFNALLEDVGEMTTDQARMARERAREAGDTMYLETLEWRERADQKISENPLGSVALAFAAGYLFCKLFDRR